MTKAKWLSQKEARKLLIQWGLENPAWASQYPVDPNGIRVSDLQLYKRFHYGISERAGIGFHDLQQSSAIRQIRRSQKEEEHIIPEIIFLRTFLRPLEALAKTKYELAIGNPTNYPFHMGLIIREKKQANMGVP